MFFKNCCRYILLLIIISSCQNSEINPHTFIQTNIKGQVDMSDILSQDQYDYKSQHLLRLDKAITYYQNLLANFPEGLNHVTISGLAYGKRNSKVKALRLRLNQEGISLESLTSSLYDLDLFLAIKRFQAINGLVATGNLDTKTEEILNISIRAKLHYLQQSRKNVAKLPSSTTQKYVIVNIPAYQLQAYKKNHYIKNIEIIVGTLENKTPVLLSRLTNIYFNPSWVVPPSLLYTTILEQLIKDSKTMKNDGFEVFEYDKNTKTYLTRDITAIDWKKYSKVYFPFIIKMRPGKANPMGKIKFEIVNNDSITIHGTTDHDLFIPNIRASSAGCIRLKDEFELAKFALDGKKGWNLAKIQSLYKVLDKSLKTSDNYQITISENIPVNIIYQNAWVDDLGFINFREDIYSTMSIVK